MERFNRLVVGALLVVLGPLLLSAPPAAAKGGDDPDERAVSRLEAMAAFLVEAKRLSVTIASTWDVTQGTGEKIEFGETRVVTIRRPDRARVEVSRRDGSRRGFLFDGTQLAVFDLDQKVYATAPRPGTLDAALEYQVGAGVGPQDAGHGAALAQVRCPRLRRAVLGDQARVRPERRIGKQERGQ